MSRRSMMLPLRLAPSAKPPQWVCRRCLATQAEPLADKQQQPPVWPEDYDPSAPFSKRINPATGEHYPLKKSDWLLKKGLGQYLPRQYLQHSTSPLLNEAEKQQREKTVAHTKIEGVVVSAGKMDKTVKVRVLGRRWEPRIGKYFSDHTNHLVHDPNSSLVAGDVVELHRLKVSTAVHHVVARIVAPFGTPVSERPPIPSPDERLATYKEHRFAKLRRRYLRRQAAMGNAEAINELKAMGLDPGHGVEAGNPGKSRDSGKSALLGAKGQKLPKGVLPGGKHEVGKIDERAKHNKQQAMKFNEKAEEHLLEAKEKAQETQEKGLSADAATGTTLERGRVD